jgi:prepilin-type N-terminal cleavage/methylation domain-containing protein
MSLLRQRERVGERGFTLIELLVIVAIVAILSSIALSQYAAYKRQSVDAAIESALHNARASMEAFYGSNGYSYGGATENDLEGYGFREPQGFSLDIVTTAINRYVLRGCQEGGTSPSWVYDSDVGKLVKDSGSCS